jgi:hypothetical protein
MGHISVRKPYSGANANAHRELLKQIIPVPSITLFHEPSKLNSPTPRYVFCHSTSLIRRDTFSSLAGLNLSEVLQSSCNFA